MSNRFEKAFQFTLKNEGGLTEDPRDPGGITKYGITLADLPKGNTADDIRNLTVIRAEEIYLAKYWKPIKGDDYNSDAKATAIFDTAVNKGLGGCKKIISDAYGVNFSGEAWEYLDGLIGAVNETPDAEFLKAISEATKRYIEARIAKYKNMAWARKGWMNRAERLLELA